MSGNQALNINTDATNGTFQNYGITSHGSDWYWAVCAVMTVSTIAVLGLAHTKQRSHRLFHYLTAAILLTASVAYFSMASGLGYVGIDVEFVRNADQTVREIFYVRYIDWFITTPLLLTDLLLTAGMGFQEIAMIIFIDEVMIVTGLVGALTSSSYKWGYWTIGTVALLYIIKQLAVDARLHAAHLGKDIGSVYFKTGALTAILWIVYPIGWAVSEGGNVIHPDSEAVLYGVLDLCAKVGFAGILLWGHRNIDPSRLGLHFREYDDKDFSSRSTAKSGTKTEPISTNGATTTAPATETV